MVEIAEAHEVGDNYFLGQQYVLDAAFSSCKSVYINKNYAASTQ